MLVHIIQLNIEWVILIILLHLKILQVSINIPNADVDENGMSFNY